MYKKLFLSVILVLLVQTFAALPVKSSSDQFPSAVTLGRYNLFEDKYWIVYNKTVQQLGSEGYEVAGESDWLLKVNYSRIGYTLKSKVVKLSWPNVTLQLVEGAHDLNVTAHRIMGDGSIGEKLASFLRTSRPPYVHPYPLEVHDPEFGVGFNPSVFTIGNTFATVLLTFTVNRTETLSGTPWGQNLTYVSIGYLANTTHSYDWTVWSDAQSGLLLKLAVESKTPTFTSYEEAEIIETGIEWDKFDVVQDGQPYKVLIDTNSTLSEFTYDSNTNRISLTVDGSAGSSGICNVTVPKGLVPAGYSIEVYVDGQKTAYTHTEDTNNYYVYVVYQHSTHTIIVGFVNVAIWLQWWFWLIIAAVVTVLVVGIYVVRKRKARA